MCLQLIEIGASTAIYFGGLWYPDIFAKLPRVSL